jgi:hypothetical protein
MNTTFGEKASFSIPSIIAIIAAFLSFSAGAGFGFFLALIAIVFGVIGVAIALSPSKRGGMASTFAVFAGAVGIVVALVKAFSSLF